MSRCHNSSRLHETRNQSAWIAELTAAVWVLEFYISLAAGTPLSVRVEVEVRIHISMRPGSLNIQGRSAGQTCSCLRMPEACRRCTRDSWLGRWEHYRRSSYDRRRMHAWCGHCIGHNYGRMRQATHESCQVSLLLQ